MIEVLFNVDTYRFAPILTIDTICLWLSVIFGLPEVSLFLVAFTKLVAHNRRRQAVARWRHAQ